MTGRISLVSLVMLITACTDGPPPLLDDLGDPCRSAHDVCLDDDSVRTCEGDVWVERDCASVCAELGPAYAPAGCEWECVCALADPSGCTPSEATCVDAGTIGVCDEAQELQPTPCADVCTNAGLNEVGCLEDDEDEGKASCWCTSEGTSCEPSTMPTCVDDASIAMCEACTWTFLACEDVCGHPAACDTFAQPAVCGC
jgi:hypothetical protein